MTSLELKKQSKSLLSKRWGNATIATFLFIGLIQIVSYIFSIALISSPVASAIITFILSIGSIYLVLCFINYCNKLRNTKERIKFSKCFVSLKQFLRYLVIAIVLAIVTIVIVGLISGLIFMSALASRIAAIISILVLTILILALVALEILSFPLAYIIILKPEYTIGQVIETSIKTGWKNSGEILYMILSFIGWNILSIITFGIGYLWVMPYMELTYVSFIEEKVKEIE